MIIKVIVVGMPGEPVHEFPSVEALGLGAQELGWTLTGRTEGAHLNKLLIGVPTFKELAGPMLDKDRETGLAKIRYETWAANKLYST